jgi:hypothetical protein
MITVQSNLCAICGKPETRVVQAGTPPRLSVDHDHKTGKVRGLLCAECNTMLAHAGDDVNRLLAAISYLERHRREAANEAVP